MSTSIPEEKRKLDDENSSQIDSGFISSGNLIVSEEIYEEPEDERKSSPFRQEDKGTKYMSSRGERMLVDSGVVCISENLSNLSLENSSLNDLGSKSQKPVECVTKNVDKNTTTSDIPWKLYYQQDENGDTHLHMAIANGLVEVASALIRIAPHPRLLDTPNDDAVTPLHLAVATHRWHIVRWLIVAGARPGPRNLAGDSPLHLACKLGDLDCCKAILFPVQIQEREMLKLSYPVQMCPKFDVDQWNYDGQTCVHIAAQNGHIEILRHLVWYGANINAREGKSGLTALHYAVQRNDENLSKFLVNECEKIDLNTTNYEGRSALQLGDPIDENILSMLRMKGVDSPYSTDDESDFSESEDEEISHENIPIFYPNLLNASA